MDTPHALHPLRSTLVTLMLLTAPAVMAQSMPVMELRAGFHRIEAEVAANQPARMQGLMQRRSLGPNQGMLFVFPFRDRHCMWMRNTLIPLAVAFLDEEGKILNIEEMKPQTENNHCATSAARFALEMNASWFATKGIAVGTRIGGIDNAPRPQ